MRNVVQSALPESGEVLAPSLVVTWMGIVLIVGGLFWVLSALALGVYFLTDLLQGTNERLPGTLGCMFLLGVFLLGFGGHWQQRNPLLVLGEDYLQFWLGRSLQWQVGYQDIERVHHVMLGDTPQPFLGVTLLTPQRFDESWPSLAKRRARNRKRWNCDLLWYTPFSSEPADVQLEAVLRSRQRFLMKRQAEARR